MSEKNKKTRLQQIGQNNSKEEENKEKVEEENNEREDKIIRLQIFFLTLINFISQTNPYNEGPLNQSPSLWLHLNN